MATSKHRKKHSAKLQGMKNRNKFKSSFKSDEERIRAYNETNNSDDLKEWFRRAGR